MQQDQELPQSIQDAFNSIMEQRKAVLDEAAKSLDGLNKLAGSIEEGVLPNPNVTDTAKKGAQRVVDICRKAEKTINDMVTVLAHADGINLFLMEKGKDESGGLQ